MTDTTLTTLTGRFFDGTTYLDESNWRTFFSDRLGSGFIYYGNTGRDRNVLVDGFAPVVDESTGYLHIKQGSAFAAGYQALSDWDFEEDIASIAPPSEAEVDCLVSIKVDANGQTATLIESRNNAESASYAFASVLAELQRDNLFSRTIPIAHGVYGYGWYDLRSVIIPWDGYLMEKSYSTASASSHTTPVPGVVFGTSFIQPTGGISYNVTFHSGATLDEYTIYPLPHVGGDRPAVIHFKNDSSNDIDIKVLNSYRGLSCQYFDDGTWAIDSTTGKRITLTAGKQIAVELRQVHKCIGASNTFGWSLKTTMLTPDAGGDPGDEYYTKAEVNSLMSLKADEEDIEALAPLASPAFTGAPTAPTPASSDNSTKIATTAFVHGAFSEDMSSYALLDSPVFTGTPTAPLAAHGSSNSQIATTKFVTNEIASIESVNAANKLANGRVLVVSLSKIYDASDPVRFDGTADTPLPITGVLPVANGGTGISSSPSVLTDLASSYTDNIFSSAPRPGVTGILPVANGGTGVTSTAEIWTSIGGGNIGKLSSLSNAGENSGVLPVANGGTGVTSTSEIWSSIGGGNIGKLASLSNVDENSGVLPVANGGTGVTSTAAIWTAIGGGDVGKLSSLSNAGENSGILPVANGGTGVASTAAIWTAIGGGDIGKLSSLSNAGENSGVLPVANGGTGVTSLSALSQALKPLSEIYVDGTYGSDTNTGANLQNAVKTIQKAIDIADPAIYTVIYVVPGTYTSGFEVSRKTIMMTTTTQGTLTISSNEGLYAVHVTGRGFLHLQGNISISSTGGCPLRISDGSEVIYDRRWPDDTYRLRLYVNVSEVTAMVEGLIVADLSRFSTSDNVVVDVPSGKHLGNVRGVRAYSGSVISTAGTFTCNFNGEGKVFSANGSIVMYNATAGNYSAVSEISNGGIISGGEE